MRLCWRCGNPFVSKKYSGMPFGFCSNDWCKYRFSNKQWFYERYRRFDDDACSATAASSADVYSAPQVVASSDASSEASSDESCTIVASSADAKPSNGRFKAAVFAVLFLLHIRKAARYTRKKKRLMLSSKKGIGGWKGSAKLR